MKTQNHIPAQTPEELLADLKSLVADAEKLAGEALSERSADVMDSLRARYAAAQERVGAFYEGAKQRVAVGARYADETVHENPYQVILVASGVALLAGLLLGRRAR